jgi:phosphatidylserine decarboxylase
MFLEKGVPKSLYRPGSSTDVLLFQQDRVELADDLVNNLRRMDVQSRFSAGFGQPLIETDLKVRSLVGTAMEHS